MNSIVKVENSIVQPSEIIDAEWWNVPEPAAPDGWEEWGPAENAELVGIVPNDPMEAMDMIQEYSNRTGFVGRMGGYNVRPQGSRVNFGAVVKVALLVVLLLAIVRLFL
jgi:hypothetical protein